MESHETPPEGDEELRAEMSAADINDLPDSDFAYIEPGGEKDDDGKTVPRSLRHFPIHDAAHVRNALARASQSPFGDKAMPKIKAAAKKFGIDVQQNSADEATEETQDALDNVTNRALVAAAERRKKERHRAVALAREYRFREVSELEVRREAHADTDIIVLRGSAIIYDSPYVVRDMFGEFEERMLPGCVSDILERGVDCRFLHNHTGMALARTTSGTLDLVDTPGSLDVVVRLDARQQAANDLAVAVERGDENQMSVGMVVGRDKWGDNGTMETRDVQVLSELLDVSQVTYPASPTTHLAVAQRMAFAMPLETRARLRQMEVELRAGKVLSADSQSKLVSALSALHDLASTGGVDLSQLDADQDAATDGDVMEPDANVSPDGTTGGNDTADTGLGAEGFPMDGTRASEPGEPIEFHRARVAIDQAWLDSLVEAGEGAHGEARKRAA